MSEEDEFIEEYAQDMADVAESVCFALEGYYGLLRDYERTKNPDKEMEKPVSREVIYENVSAERIGRAMDKLPTKTSVQSVFNLYCIGSGVSDTAEDYMQTFYDGHDEAMAYLDKIHTVVDDIQEYDDEFALESEHR